MTVRPSIQSGENTGDCAEYSLLLTACFDGEADDHEREQAQKHLNSCAPCYHRWQEWRRNRSLVQRVPGCTPPPHLLARILTACRLTARLPGSVAAREVADGWILNSTMIPAPPPPAFLKDEILRHTVGAAAAREAILAAEKQNLPHWQDSSTLWDASRRMFAALVPATALPVAALCLILISQDSAEFNAMSAAPRATTSIEDVRNEKEYSARPSQAFFPSVQEAGKRDPQPAASISSQSVSLSNERTPAPNLPFRRIPSVRPPSIRTPQIAISSSDQAEERRLSGASAAAGAKSSATGSSASPGQAARVVPARATSTQVTSPQVTRVGRAPLPGAASAGASRRPQRRISAAAPRVTRASWKGRAEPLVSQPGVSHARFDSVRAPRVTPPVPISSLRVVAATTTVTSAAPAPVPDMSDEDEMLTLVSRVRDDRPEDVREAMDEFRAFLANSSWQDN